VRKPNMGFRDLMTALQQDRADRLIYLDGLVELAHLLAQDRSLPESSARHVTLETATCRPSLPSGSRDPATNEAETCCSYSGT
jgi:hypothetical protein